MPKLLISLVLLLPFLLGNVASAQQAADEVAPEAAIDQNQSTVPKAKPDNPPAPDIPTPAELNSTNKSVKSGNWMVSVANPIAAKAAADILRGGGSAADAAIAAQAMLGLVEPQSSGLGGGAFLVYYDARSGDLTTLDGRETAPAAATPKLFLDEDGKPLKFFDAVVGGRSVGVPGTPALLSEMHRRWGKKRWFTLLAPAALAATQGFAVSPRLAGLVERSKDFLSRQQTAANYFLPDGIPIRAGAILKNPDYAATLRLIADEGVKPFYRGDLASRIVATVRGFAPNPGLLSRTDMASYSVEQRDPVCVIYRLHQVCGMGPPSSGALTVGQILGLMQPYDLASLGHNDLDSWRLIGDASRLAFADRGRYMADTDFVPVPVAGLLDTSYLQERSLKLTGIRALDAAEIEAGTPPWDHAHLRADDDALELPSTSHFSIVDKWGNAVSMTTTIENAFGSRLMVGGFLLNNELTDFSFRSHKDGIPVANRVEPRKRPRSSMAPTIVLKYGKPKLLVGSPGGSRIIGYVAKTIIAWLDWKLDIQSAIELPHLVNRFGTYDIEAGTDAERLNDGLKRLGYETEIRDLNSGIHAIEITPDGLEGGADPRREGVVIGG